MSGRLVAVLATVALTTGCQELVRTEGELVDVTEAVPTGPALEWLSIGQDEAMYFRWRVAPGVDGGQLAGLARFAERNADLGRIDIRSRELRGAANGGQVVVSAGDDTWTGTITGDTLVLTVDNPDGSRAELTLERGTAADFDAAVASMRGSIPTTTTLPAPPPSSPASTETTATEGADGPTAGEVEVAIERLQALQASGPVDDVEAALDAMYAVAGRVFGVECDEATAAAVEARAAAAAAEELVDAVDALAVDLELQRDAVRLLGIAHEAAGGDPAVAAVANDALDPATRYVDELRRYASEVRAATDATVEGVDDAVADC